LIIFAVLGCLLAAGAQDDLSVPGTNAPVRVVVVHGDNLLNAFLPDDARVEAAFNRGLMSFAREITVGKSWRTIVNTNDIVGIKVFSEPGPVSGTRPSVVAAIVRGLLAAGIPRNHIIIWDRQADDLRSAGYFDLGRTLGVRVAGAEEDGYDTNTYYLPDSPVIGQLVWGDLEFGFTNRDYGVGKKSFMSKLVSQQITKIISVAPLMNENEAGVCGHFFSLGLGSVDNTRRFEGNPDRLAVALPELNALPLIGDRVALYVTDALLSQCEGGPSGYLQFSTVQNELWLSRDAVALDTMAIKQLVQQRQKFGAPDLPANLNIYTNAVLMQLGVEDPSRIRVENVQ
jgi:hypothetical protein